MNSVENNSRLDVPFQDCVRSAMHGLWTRYYFKFVLPRIKSTEIDGVKLDLTGLSPKVRNRILMGYEEAEKHMCRELLHEEDAVLELGGGIGFIGLFCQKQLGVRQYVTVEANPNTISLLDKNYRLNGLSPNVFHFALHDTCGPVDLDVSGDFWEHSVGFAPNATRSIQVPGITFTELLGEIPIRPDALIIDVEGAEQFIDFREIPEEIKKIIIEIHPVIVGQPVVREILDTLCERGFRIASEEGDTLAFTKEF